MLAPGFVLALLCWAAAPAWAADDPPLREPDQPAAAVPGAPAVSAEARVNEGLALQKRQDWTGAERAFRAAIRLEPALPEAWNGLGYALRQQRKYDDSVRAYQEALRLRPQYPSALEYLGEAYVQMGRLDEARRVLERLRPLDPREAAELEQAIARASRR
jgi:tetratricopeptide (TPR) repeat protein